MKTLYLCTYMLQNPRSEGGASICLGYILMAGCASQKSSGSPNGVTLNSASVEEPLQALVSWMVSQLQSSASSSLTLVTPTLTVLMSAPEARRMFQNSGGIGYLSRHLRVRNSAGVKMRRDVQAGASVQQLYELCFCLWTLTYELNESMSIRTCFARDGAIPALVDLVAVAPREKVVRVALSALLNLAVCNDDMVTEPGKKEITASTFLSDMIGCGLMKSIEFLRERPWTDPDIVAGK
jgi:V-type H+-transporting ATPase subunit H